MHHCSDKRNAIDVCGVKSDFIISVAPTGTPHWCYREPVYHYTLCQTLLLPYIILAYYRRSATITVMYRIHNYTLR